MKLWICENHIYVHCRVKNYIAERCTGIAEVKGSNHVQACFFFSDLLFATAKAAYITAIIFIHIIQIIIVNTQALWFHDMFYGQNRLLLAHAFNILSAAICFLIILTCTLLDCFPIVKLENLTVRFPFWRNPNLLNSIVCLTSS